MHQRARFKAHPRDVLTQVRAPSLRPALGLVFAWLLLSVSPASAAVSITSSRVVAPVAAGGKAQAVIVVGAAAGEGAKYAATELQKYLRILSGAEIPIITDGENSVRSSRQSSILIGGPNQNRLVKQAMDAGLTGFSGLKPDGFVLKTRRLGRQAVIVAGGNDDAGTMYAVFDLVERLGVTFRLTGDIVPRRRSSLEIPALDLVRDPAVALRGFLLEATMHESITALSYQDYVKLLDQMAKMKLNYIEFWWFPYEPWLNYSYRGEPKMIGDVSTKVSAYINTMYDGYGSRTTDDVSIGKHWFPSRRIVAPEFEHVETPEQAFTATQDLLRRMIHYAKTKHIQVWLVDEMAAAPPNLARHGEIIGERPFQGVFGAEMHPLDPVNREIQVNRLQALIKTYPEAEGYYLNFSEVYYPQNNAKHHAFYVEEEPKFQELNKLRAPWVDWQNVGGQAMIDSNIGYFDLFKYLLAERDKISPNTKLGMALIGRGYVMPLFDKMLPKNVPFASYDAGGWCSRTPEGVPMSYFGNMGQRQRIYTPFIDADCDILSVQFNVGLYSRVDRIFSDGVMKYGLTGVAAWMSRPRGTEANSSFLAEADWDPQLTMEQFYKSYSQRLFGEKAAPDIYQAFMTLEELRSYWARTEYHSPRSTTMGCCGGLREVSVMHDYSGQNNPFGGPTVHSWKPFIHNAPAVIAHFQGSIPLLDKALASLRAAEPKVAPRGQRELAYLINRTEAYEDDIRAEITEHRAFLAFDESFQMRSSISYEQFVGRLESSLKEFQEAHRQAQVATAKYAEIIDYPSDLEALYHLNAQTVLGFDLNDQWIQKIVNFHEGKPYTEHVPFERLFTGGVHLGN